MPDHSDDFNDGSFDPFNFEQPAEQSGDFDDPCDWSRAPEGQSSGMTWEQFIDLAYHSRDVEQLRAAINEFVRAHDDDDDPPPGAAMPSPGEAMPPPADEPDPEANDGGSGTPPTGPPAAILAETPPEAVQPVPEIDWGSDEPEAPRAIQGPQKAVPTRLAQALRMAARGFRVLPLKVGDKVPMDGMPWKEIATTDQAAIRGWFEQWPDMNYGVAGGRGLLVLDLDQTLDRKKDGEASLARLEAEHAPLPATLTVGSPGGGRHIYLHVDEDVSNTGKPLGEHIDVKSEGGYVVGPGSRFTDPTGAKGYTGSYKILADLPVAKAPEWLMLRFSRAREKATDRAPLAEQDTPENVGEAIEYLKKSTAAIEGRGGDKTTFDVACWVRDLGISEELAFALMSEHYNPRCEPPWDDEGLRVKVRNAFEYGQNAPGAKSAALLADQGGDPADAAALQSPPAENHGEPIDLWREFSVPDVPEGVLPDAIERFATSQATDMGACRNALTFAALTALSSAIDHRCSLRMTRHTSWSVSPRVWTMLIGGPSSKKTPIINAAVSPLTKLQARKNREWRDKCALVPDGKNPKLPAPAERFVAIDVTVEALASILGQQERGGLLVCRDELAGWIGSMERYSNGRGSLAERGFWLEAYNGGSYTVDRVSRGSQFVEKLSVSLIGGIQPDRLAELQGGQGQSLQSDGLLQRFLPIYVGPGGVAEDRPGQPTGYDAFVQQAASLAPAEYEFDDEAVAIATRFRHRVHDLQRASETAHRGFAQFVGKLDGLFGTFCLLFHVADGLEHWFSERVGAGVAERVTRLFDEFILPHAYEFYREAEHVAGTNKLQAIGSWILTSGRTRILVSDLPTYVTGFRGLDAFQITRALGGLVAGGWLDPENPGPANRAWRVSPRVATLFTRHREAEERRKRELAKLMNAPRKPRTGMERGS